MHTDQFRVVCALQANHPHHEMHTRPCASYTDAAQLAQELAQPEASTDDLFMPCHPFRVQQGIIAWADVR